MKSLMWLLEGVLLDSSTRCGANTHRDFITISRRVEHEGISFLTLSLPRFAQDFERCLEQGAVGPTHFLGFKRCGALPRFLGGLLDQVFNRVDGCLLTQPSVEAILSVRQICLAFKKLNLQCSPRRVKEAIDGYVECENDLVRGTENLARTLNTKYWECDCETSTNGMGASSSTTTGSLPCPACGFRKYQRIAYRFSSSWKKIHHYSPKDTFRALWSSVFGGQRSDDLESYVRLDTIPRHGPGATAERIQGNAKYTFRKWHSRLERSFPVDSYAMVSIGAIEDGELDKIEIVEPGEEQPVKVTPVPKTQKGPRIIAIEPVCMQYTQQGLERFITKRLSSHPLTRGRINFTDQSINRELALKGSKDGSYATLDLSEASDRVHMDLVRAAFSSVPVLLEALEDSRSSRSNLQDGRTIHLTKFASMGSACCFPVLAMVLYGIIVDWRLRKLRLPLSMRSLKQASRDVYVYGDDIIVPSDEAPAIALHLEKFLLKVNSNKSFMNGKFRESCGMDAYDGTPVTPTYLRMMPPSDRRQVDRLASYVATANLFYKGGWWQTARRLREMVERVIGRLPHVGDTSPGLGWYSFMGYSVQRWNRDLHRFEVSAPVIVPKRKSAVLDGWPALLKCLLTRGEEPLERRHLQSDVLRGEANIKRRWVTPH
nr:MAG: hypothetical protein 3 [Leviviridae sp.]